MASIISIKGLGKTYKSGLQALKTVDLEIEKGEIFALLGPNGAGKTTLISIVCGIVTPSSGTVTVDGHDHITAYRAARTRIGWSRRASHDAFETVWATSISAAGCSAARPTRRLSRRSSRICRCGTAQIEDHGAVGRDEARVMIAKALSHEPEILFLDEPTAGWT